MRKTSVPAPFRGLMIAGVVVAVAAPFLGWILQALALLINSYWSTPCIDYILVEVIPCVRLGGVLLFLWGALGFFIHFYGSLLLVLMLTLFLPAYHVYQ